MAAETEIIARFKADVTDMRSKMGQVKGDLKGVEDATTATHAPMTGMQKAAIGAGIAMGAMVAVKVVDWMKDAATAAMAEEAELAKLNLTLQNLGFADASAQINLFIDDLQFAAGVADTDLRAAFEVLLRSTKDVGEAQRALALSTDIAAGSGKDLSAVAQAMGKAYSGSTVGLSRLNAGLDVGILKTGDMKQITGELGRVFGGQAAANADTMAGRLRTLGIAADELQESFGKGFLDNFATGAEGMKDATEQLRDMQTSMEDIGGVGADFLEGLIAGTGTFIKVVQSMALEAAYRYEQVSIAIEQANNEINDYLNLTSDEEGALARRLLAERTAANDAAYEIGIMNLHLGENSPAALAAAEASGAAAAGAEELAAGSEEAAAALDAVKAAFLSMNAALTASQSMDDFKKSLHDLDKTLEGNKRSFRGMGDGAKENRDELRSAFGDAAAIAQKWAEDNGKSAAQAKTYYDGLGQDIVDQFAKDGFEEADIMAFLGKEAIWTGPAKDALSKAERAALSKAYSGFDNVGRDAGKGFAGGLDASWPLVTARAIAIANRAEASAKAALDEHSPSMVFHDIGMNAGAGLANGLRDSATTVESLSMTLGEKVVKAYVEGMASTDEETRKQAKATLLDAVNAAYQSGLDELRSNLDKAQSMALSWRSKMLGLLNMGSAFSAAQSKDKAEADALKQLTDAQKGLAEAQAQAAAATTDPEKASAGKRVESTRALVAAAQAAYQAAAGAAATSWVDEFRLQMTQASNFMALLQQLKASGAHQMLIDQIASAGPEAGTAMAKDLINGGAAGTGGLIDEFNTGFTAFDAGATALGVDFANAWAQAVGPDMGGLTAAKTLKAFREEFGPGGPGRERMMRIMDNISAAMAREVTVTVRVNRTGGVDIEGRALGGSVTGDTPYWVGERGPELFVPPTGGGSITPNNRLGGGGGGGGVVNNYYSVTVPTLVGNRPETGRIVVEAIEDFARTNGPVYAKVMP
jgi:hypothetical protein